MTPPTEEGETWRAVPGYAGLYKVSNLGRVWSVPRRIWREASERSSGYWCQVGGRLLKPKPDTCGYLNVGLARDGITQTRLIHQLVARAFLGPAPAGMEVLHGPNGKLDNSLDNLRYGTKIENQADRLRDGTDGRGERNSQAKLTEDDVIEIRRLYSSTERLSLKHPGRWTHQKLGEKFGMSQSVIGKIVNGKNWAHTEEVAA